jgi:hypothetical protein
MRLGGSNLEKITIDETWITILKTCENKMIEELAFSDFVFSISTFQAYLPYPDEIPYQTRKDRINL